MLSTVPGSVTSSKSQCHSVTDIKLFASITKNTKLQITTAHDFHKM